MQPSVLVRKTARSSCHETIAVAQSYTVPPFIVQHAPIKLRLTAPRARLRLDIVEIMHWIGRLVLRELAIKSSACKPTHLNNAAAASGGCSRSGPTYTANPPHKSQAGDAGLLDQDCK